MHSCYTDVLLEEDPFASGCMGQNLAMGSGKEDEVPEEERKNKVWSHHFLVC